MSAAAPKLYRAIIDELRAEIVSGKYRPGDRLPPERELVERFDVSRLTLREAIIGMEIMGLVEARRGSGVYVIDQADDRFATSELDIGAFELTEARRMVEGEAAALAAINAQADDIAELREILDRMIAENREEMHDEIADREFHMRIAQTTGNDAIVLVVETLWDVRHRSPLCENMLEKSRRSGVKPRIDDHRAIIDAIADGDAAAARKAMRDHLGRVVENLLVATEMEAMERVKAEAAELRDRARRFAAM
jgi:GntR family transcriptional regulator, hexuronate regulon transcriptional repressor